MDQLVREASEGELDLTPPPPPEEAILRPGHHLIEVAFARPLTEKDLIEALTKMGFARVLLDQIRGPEIRPAGAPHEFATRFRFTAETALAIRVVNTPLVSWEKLFEIPREAPAFMCELERGATYALRFIARMRPHPSREATREALSQMGWKADALMALQRNIRVPERPSISVTRWLTTAVWEGPESYITDEEKIYFECATKTTTSISQVSCPKATTQKTSARSEDSTEFTPQSA